MVASPNLQFKASRWEADFFVQQAAAKKSALTSDGC
jgi:hypothetical protein